MNKNRKSKRIIVTVLIILCVFLFALPFIAFVVPTFDEPISLLNTTEFIATVERIELKTSGPKQSGIIYTKEYGNTKIGIQIFDTEINLENFKTLKKGDIISFRVENTWVEHFDSMMFISALEMYSNGKEIIALESVVKKREDSIRNIQITSMVFEAIFLAVIVICAFKLKNTK